MNLKVWESLQDPVLVRKILVGTAHQVERLTKLLVIHADFTDSYGCLESVQIEQSITVVVLPFKVLDDCLRMVL